MPTINYNNDTNNPNFGCVTALILFSIMGIAFIFGFCIGQMAIYDNYKRDVCQAISITTEDYINCNNLDWKIIIKQIPKRRK